VFTRSLALLPGLLKHYSNENAYALHTVEKECAFGVLNWFTHDVKTLCVHAVNVCISHL